MNENEKLNAHLYASAALEFGAVVLMLAGRYQLAFGVLLAALMFWQRLYVLEVRQVRERAEGDRERLIREAAQYRGALGEVIDIDPESLQGRRAGVGLTTTVRDEPDPLDR